MVFEPTENEPAEYDPEEDLRDPEADGPTIPSIDPPDEYDPEADFADPTTDSLTIPSVDVGPDDVPSELRRHFWGTVLVLNAAFLMGSVGLMIAFFWRDFERAGVLVVGCLLLLALTYRRHRRFDFDAVMDESDDDAADGTEDS